LRAQAPLSPKASDLRPEASEPPARGSRQD
jgi:hypothetical protein